MKPTRQAYPWRSKWRCQVMFGSISLAIQELGNLVLSHHAPSTEISDIPGADQVNGRMRIALLSACLLLLGSLFCPMGNAQVSQARLTGSVADTTGASIDSAQVTIKNLQTDVIRTVQTNKSGLYSAPSLDPGRYSVEVSANGFTKEIRSDVTLIVGSEQVLNFALKVGSVSDVVVVNDAPPAVELSSSELSGSVNGETMRALPLNGRSWTDLAVLTPGVSAIQTQPPVSASDRPKRGLGSQLSISGGRPQQNSYLLDGININDYSNAGPGSVLGGNLGVDALQEFTVVTTNPSAQYGRTSGGVISAVTRSGTNQLHGSAYEFFRDNALDTRNYFDTGAKPPFRRNQFGGSLGGPIQKDKTFIFGDYEGVRQNLGATILDTVPSADARAGRLSTGFMNPDPAVARFITAFYPLPNGAVQGDVGNYSFAGTQNTTENFFTVKMDHTFTDKDNAAAVYMFDLSPSSQNDELNNKLILSKTVRQTISLLETHIFSAKTVILRILDLAAITQARRTLLPR